MADTIIVATEPEHYAAFAALIRDYVAWCRDRFQSEAWFIDEVLSHQSLEHELDGLAGKYGPPKGVALLARHEGEACGCVAYHRMADGICEMKRLFVPDRFRGHGYGRKLCEALVKAAKAENYRLMRLDTVALMTEAIAMYKSIGFRECPPYQEYPEKLKPRVLFLEMPLPQN